MAFAFTAAPPFHLIPASASRAAALGGGDHVGCGRRSTARRLPAGGGIATAPTVTSACRATVAARAVYDRRISRAQPPLACTRKLCQRIQIASERNGGGVGVGRCGGGRGGQQREARVEAGREPSVPASFRVPHRARCTRHPVIGGFAPTEPFPFQRGGHTEEEVAAAATRSGADGRAAVMSSDPDA
ncbi:unnamed protein product [Lampetra planeri]